MKFYSLLKAQIQQERRSGEQLVLGLSFSLVLGALTFLSLASAYLDSYAIQKLFPSLYWILFLFSATIAVGRSFEADIEFKAVDAIRIALRGKEEIYFFVKWICSTVLVFILGLTLLLTVLLFCPVQLPNGSLLAVLDVLALTVPSFGALSVIISAVLTQQRLRAILLPCLLFPLLTPVLFAAVELSFGLMQGELSMTASPWFWILVLTGFAYPLLGSILFSASLEE